MGLVITKQIVSRALTKSVLLTAVQKVIPEAKVPLYSEIKRIGLNRLMYHVPFVRTKKRETLLLNL